MTDDELRAKFRVAVNENFDTIKAMIDESDKALLKAKAALAQLQAIIDETLKTAEVLK